MNLLFLYVHMRQCLYEFAFECINNKCINNKNKLHIICSQMSATEAPWPRHLLYIIYLYIHIYIYIYIYIYIHITMFILTHNRSE